MRRAAGRAPLYAHSTSLLLLQPPRLRLPARSFLAAFPSLAMHCATPPATALQRPAPRALPVRHGNAPRPLALARLAVTLPSQRRAQPFRFRACSDRCCPHCPPRRAPREARMLPALMPRCPPVPARRSPILLYLSARHLLVSRAPIATSSAPPYSARSCVVGADWGRSAGNAQGGAATWGRRRWRRWEGQAAQCGGGLERLWMRGWLVGAHTAYGQARSTHACTQRELTFSQLTNLEQRSVPSHATPSCLMHLPATTLTCDFHRPCRPRVPCTAPMLLLLPCMI
ncbi:unnamed protein product [Closterium sp. Naga37s-1]|nr:unnamed protein product [Closterium sp. Naga37s-1]